MVVNATLRKDIKESSFAIRTDAADDALNFMHLIFFREIYCRFAFFNTGDFVAFHAVEMNVVVLVLVHAMIAERILHRIFKTGNFVDFTFIVKPVKRSINGYSVARIF